MKGPGQRSWAEEMAQLGVQMMTLPFRLFGAGLQAMAQAMEGAQRTPGQNAQPWRSADGAPAAWGGALSATEPASSFYPASSNGNAESRGGAIEESEEKSETKAKEDKAMTCCDNDLSGCELKVVQYSIVSVDPYLKDVRRMVTREPRTIATSEDMTDADFTAYVIAKAMREDPARFRRYKTKYLRVCYSVICRLTMPCSDYDKEQVDALRAINRTLMGKGNLNHQQLSRLEDEEALEELREEEDHEDDNDTP